MKRLLVPLAILVVLGAALLAGWRAFSSWGGAAQGTPLLSTAQTPCPQATQNDLAGIEGWAPGAGQAERGSQYNQHNVGGFANALGGTPQTPTPTAAPANVPQCRVLAPVVEQYFNGIAQADRDLARPTFDPQNLARQAGTEPQKIFAYVRDTLATQPYPGTMRGPLGTVFSGGGSPADKAWVLGALLISQNIPVQYVHTALSDDDANRIITAVESSTSAGAPTPDAASSPVPAAMVDFAKKYNAYANSTDDALISQAQGATVKLLDQSGAHLAGSDAAARAQAVADLRDHWWVRAQIDGSWTDLDPTLPDAAPGTHVGGPPSDAPQDALPDALHTQVTMTLAAAYDDSTTATLATRTASTVELYDQPVEFGFANNATIETIPQTTNFTPFISMGGQRTVGTPLSIDPQSHPALSSLTLTVSTNSPGRPARTYTRTIFDRSAGQQPAYALQTLYYGLVVSGDVGTAFDMQEEAVGIASVHAQLDYVAKADGKEGGFAPNGAMLFPIPALRYLAADEHLRGRMEASSGYRFYIDRPQIVFFRHRLTPGRQNAVQVAEGIDVFDNGMAALAAQGGAAVQANAVRGYADDEIERRVISSFGGSDDIVTADLTEPPGVALRALDASQIGSVPAPPNVRSALAASIGAGIAIAPSQPRTIAGAPRFGWWSLDPDTGNMVGRLDMGGGQADTEYTIDLGKAMQQMRDAQFLGSCMECYYGAQADRIRGVSEGDVELSQAQCVAAAACSYIAGFGIGKGLTETDHALLAFAYSVVSRLAWFTNGHVSTPHGKLCNLLFR